LEKSQFSVVDGKLVESDGEHVEFEENLTFEEENE